MPYQVPPSHGPQATERMFRFLQSMPLHRVVGGPLALLLLIGILSVTLSLVVNRSQEGDAVTLNAAGRQRALAQSIMREAALSAVEADGAERLARAQQAALWLRHNLRVLQEGGALEGPGASLSVPGTRSAAFRDQLSSVAGAWVPFNESLGALADASGDADGRDGLLRALERETDTLTGRMEGAVAVYQAEAQRRARIQRRIQVGFLAAGGIMLGLTWLSLLRLVVRPVQRLRLAAGSLERGVALDRAEDPLLPEEVGELVEAVEAFWSRVSAHSRQQETLLRLSAALQPLVDPHEVLDQTLAIVTRHFEADGACILARPGAAGDPGAETLHRCTGLDSGRIGTHRDPAIAAEASTFELPHTDPLVVSRTRPDHPGLPGVLEDLLAPLWEVGVEESAIVPFPTPGLLVVNSRAAGQFSAEHLGLLVLAARQVSSALLRAAEFQRAEEASERYRSLYDNVPVGIFRCCPDGHIESVNRTLATMLGFASPDELNGVQFATLWQDEQACQQWLWASSRSTGTSRTECLLKARGDGTLWAEVSVRPMAPTGEGLAHLEGTMRDVTLRRKAQETVEILSRAVTQSADAIFVTDREGRIQYVNPALEEITGFSASELLGGRPAIMRSGEHTAAFYREFWETILGGRAFKGEFSNRRKDGRLYRELKTITPIRDPQGVVTHFVSVGRDITREREMEEQLRRSHQMEAVGQLAGGVAHDFNNFLAVINGYTQLLLQRLEPGDPIRGDLEGMSQAAQRAGRLVSQLLAFSRKQALFPETFSLNDLLGRLEGMLRPLVGEAIQLTFDLQPDLWRVEADQHQLEQVVINLVVNARDAMPGGGLILIETRNRSVSRSEARKRGLATPGDYILLGVSDTGPGIPADVMKDIFNPFFTTKPPGEGTGLGLSMAYGVVTQSGGSIWVDCEEGRGTTFSILLPRTTQAVVAGKEAERSAGPQAPREGSVLPRGDESILLVEDSAMVRAVTRMMLEEQGYRVLETDSGERALELLQEVGAQVDLLFTDVLMPGMSGPELASHARRLFPGLPVLLMSGVPENVGAGDGGTGSIPFIRKPFHLSNLLIAVRSALDAERVG